MQHGFEQGGLSGAGVAGEGEAADAFRGWRHDATLLLKVVRAIRTLMAVVVQARQRQFQGFSEPAPDARGIFDPRRGL
jgi:hypothetical protein